MWTSGTAVSEDGNTLIYDENCDIRRNTLTPEDRVFIRRLRNLVINVILILEFLPPLIPDIDKKNLAAHKGFGGPLRKSKVLDWFPRWLSKGFSINKLDSSQLTEEILDVEEILEEEQTEIENAAKRTHSSPIAHWRKGHWGVLESGEGKRWKNGKRIWIRPIYVNS